MSMDFNKDLPQTLKSFNLPHLIRDIDIDINDKVRAITFKYNISVQYKDYIFIDHITGEYEETVVEKLLKLLKNDMNKTLLHFKEVKMLVIKITNDDAANKLYHVIEGSNRIEAIKRYNRDILNEKDVLEFLEIDFVLNTMPEKPVLTLLNGICIGACTDRKKEMSLSSQLEMLISLNKLEDFVDDDSLKSEKDIDVLVQKLMVKLTGQYVIPSIRKFMKLQKRHLDEVLSKGDTLPNNEEFWSPLFAKYVNAPRKVMKVISNWQYGDSISLMKKQIAKFKWDWDRKLKKLKFYDSSWVTKSDAIDYFRYEPHLKDSYIDEMLDLFTNTFHFPNRAQIKTENLTLEYLRNEFKNFIKSGCEIKQICKLRGCILCDAYNKSKKTIVDLYLDKKDQKTAAGIVQAIYQQSKNTCTTALTIYSFAFSQSYSVNNNNGRNRRNNLLSKTSFNNKNDSDESETLVSSNNENSFDEDEVEEEIEGEFDGFIVHSNENCTVEDNSLKSSTKKCLKRKLY